VPNDAQGALQDIHWSMGGLGYFPTYSQGSFFASQWYFAIAKNHNIPELITNQSFEKILSWHTEYIHQYGRLYTSNELCEKASGSILDFTFFVIVFLVFLPLNFQSFKENGCLQVIKRSHKLGRVNHGFSGEQVGADMVMVNHALETLEHVYVDLQPGDALFFHSNLLHRSEANLSDHPRWSIISCYNSLSNHAFNDPSTSWREPVKIVADEAMMADSIGGASATADFLRKEDDPALKETGWEKEVKTT
jgi:hypothetical protein